VFGLSSAAARALNDALHDPATVKEYLALVRGRTAQAFESRRPLSKVRGGPARPARTELTRLDVLKVPRDPPAPALDLSLLRARIRTGRLHQVRRHLHHCAHQVIGDTRYGKGRINRDLRARFGLPRLFLHAQRLRVAHPAGGVLEVTEPLWPDLAAFLARLPGADPARLAELSRP